MAKKQPSYFTAVSQYNRIKQAMHNLHAEMEMLARVWPEATVTIDAWKDANFSALEDLDTAVQPLQGHYN